MDFTSDDFETESLLRAFGCMVMSAMPAAGVEDAVRALIRTYDFAFEDATMDVISSVEQVTFGCAAGELVSGD